MEKLDLYNCYLDLDDLKDDIKAKWKECWIDKQEINDVLLYINERQVKILKIIHNLKNRWQI